MGRWRERRGETGVSSARFRARAGAAAGSAPAVGASEIPVPTPFSRRRALFVRDCRGKAPSGVSFSPEGEFPQPRRRKTNLRRGFDAGGRVSYGIPSGVHVPAQFSRRKTHFRSSGVRSLSSGVILRRKTHFGTADAFETPAAATSRPTYHVMRILPIPFTIPVWHCTHKPHERRSAS